MVSWKNFRPLGTWLLVKADPRVKKTKGGILLTDGQVMAERVMEGTGEILKVGSNEKISRKVGVALEPGMRVCYRGFLKDASAHEFDIHEDGCPVFMLAADDILAVIDKTVKMGAFS